MKTEAIIILGAGVMQGPVIQTAKELGFHAIALDGSRDAVNIPMADQFEQIDLKNKEEIESFARLIQNRFRRIGIMTAGTDFSASVAWTAEKLFLPGIPYETALNASDKSRMRECFKKAGVPSPEFAVIEGNKGTKDICSIFDLINNKTKITNSNSLFPSVPSIPSFPLVIKPVDNMGARGCRRVDSPEELEEAVKSALEYSGSGRAIIEEYMEGPEFSVDAIINHGEITITGLADRHIFFPPYFIEMGHTMPSKIDLNIQTELLDIFRNGIRALGLSDKENIGAAKGDIKLTTNQQPLSTNKDGIQKPMIGEIAARLSGGYMSGWTYPYSSGASPIKAAILLAMGKEPEGLIPVKNWVCAERAFISIPGTVKAITGMEEAKKMPFVNDIFLRIAPGDKVDFPKNNVSKCGNVISSAPDRETAVKAAENAVRTIRIHLDPANPKTNDYLTADKHEYIRTEEFNIKNSRNCSCADPMQVELQIEQKNAEIIVSTVYK